MNAFVTNLTCLVAIATASPGAGLTAAAAENITTSAPAPPAACMEQGGSSCAKDFAMEHEETYKGAKIRIRTDRAPDGAWQGTQPIAAPLAAPGTYASEQEARSAALSAAAAEVDRSRAGTGKP